MSWPDVFVVGAPKCGTTSMHAYLGQHPDIFVAGRKELHYYTRELLTVNTAGPGDAYSLRATSSSEQEYRDSFRGASEFRRAADVSPSYLFWNQVAPQIHMDQPDARILIMLRDPVEKAFSQYLHQRRAQFETLSFEGALAAEAERAASGWSDVWYYVGASRYSAQVGAYLEVFGPQRVKVVITEELAAHPQSTMADVFAFLDVDPDALIQTTTRNRSGEVRSQSVARLIAQPNAMKRLSHYVLPKSVRYRLALRMIEINTGEKPELSEGTRSRLRDSLAPDVQELEDLLGRQLPWPTARVLR